MNRFIDNLQVVTTNNYNTIVISTLYISLGHTVKCSQVVTRRFLLTAPTMTIPLPPGSSLRFIDSSTELTNVQVKVTLRLTVSQSLSLGVEHHLGFMTRYLLLFDSYGLVFLWGALSNERTVLSFVYAAGSCQRSLSRVRVPWYSRPYFTVSDLRLLFSSPPTTRRVTVEVFDPSSTWVGLSSNLVHC
jgi:hypothetical protein